MKKITWVTLILCTGMCAMLASPLGAQEKAASESAKAIVDKMLDKTNTLGVKSGQVEVTLLVEDRAGTKRLKKLIVQSKSIAEQGKTRVKLTAPKDVVGQAFLFSENKNAEDDVWMFLPAFSVTRRIEGSQKQGAFLGSHFTFADLESRDIKKATYERQKDEKIGKMPVFVIDSIPKGQSNYKRVRLYVRQKDHMPLRFKFYGEDKKTPIKTIFVENISKTASGQSYIKQMTLRPKGGGYTTIGVDKVDDKVNLSDALFSKEQLGK